MKMRILLLLTSLCVLLTGCSKEPAENPGSEQDNGTQLSFTYKNNTGAATYAATVPAETAEKAIRDLSIFAFYADGTFLRELAEGNDYAETPGGDGQTVVTVSDDFLTANLAKSLEFYFVANNAASTGGKHIASFTGTSDDFEELLTTPLADGVQTDSEGNLRAENITITPGTGGLLMTGKTGVISIFGKRTVPVTLKRRVARFDISNPSPAEYRINNIFIDGARTRTHVFADAQGTPSIPARSTDSFTGPASYDGTLATCAFYLYPTDLLTTSVAMEIEYIGEGVDKGKKVVFTLDPSTAADKNIYANKRYTLTIDPASLAIVFDTSDWDDGII